MIRLLYNYPCIAVWVPFNEGWGQFDANKATALIRKKDPDRLVNEACGWFDQKGGDMYSIHNYVRKLKVKPQDRVVALDVYKRQISGWLIGFMVTKMRISSWIASLAMLFALRGVILIIAKRSVSIEKGIMRLSLIHIYPEQNQIS